MCRKYKSNTGAKNNQFGGKQKLKQFYQSVLLQCISAAKYVKAFFIFHHLE